MNEILNFISGSITAIVTGVGAEREITRAIRQGVKFKRISRKSSITLEVKLGALDFMKLKKMLTNCEIKRIKTSGMALVLRLVLSRVSIAVFVVLFLTGILFSSMYTVNISVSGNETIPTNEVLKFLKENGIERFTPKSKVDLSIAENLLEEKFENIDLVNVFYKGSELNVEIIEGSPVPNIRENEPCDILATNDGVIQKMTVESGMPVVEEFQAVKTGDLLVRGNYVKNETEYSAHSRAKIIAKVDYTALCKIDDDGKVKVKTGRQTILKYLKIGETWVKIDGEIPYELYDGKARQVGTIGENLPLSSEIYDVIYSELMETDDDETLSIGMINAKEKAYYDALSKVPEDAEIVGVESNIHKDEGKLTAAVTITVLQDICTKSEASPLPEEDKIGEKDNTE